MKLIKPSYTILNQEPGLEGIYKMIELAGRTCYKSESQITEDSAKKFVDMLIARGHTAMLEHGTVYLKEKLGKPWNPITDGLCKLALPELLKYEHNQYSILNSNDDYIYVTTNYRVLYENDWLNDLKYLCESTEYHEKRVSVRFNTDIGVTRELNRHRVNSPAEQSTRYCNYSKKDKFNSEIAVSLNEDITESDVDYLYDKWNHVGGISDTELFEHMCYDISIENTNFTILDTWFFANLAAQWSYMNLIKLGWKPEQARRVLPLDLHTEIVHTAFVSDWKHCFDLRVDGITGVPHIDMKALISPIKEEFEKRQWLK